MRSREREGGGFHLSSLVDLAIFKEASSLSPLCLSQSRLESALLLFFFFFLSLSLLVFAKGGREGGRNSRNEDRRPDIRSDIVL